MGDTQSTATPQGSAATRHETRFERLRSRRRTSFRRWLAAHFYDIWTLLHEARIPLLGFCIVMATGTLYWTHIYEGQHYSFGAALYETMTMLVLEQDTRFPHDPLGKILFFAIPIFGLAFVFQGVLDFGRLLLDKSSRLEAWQIALARTYKQHIILAGLGSVSYRVLQELLEAGYDVVVIERNWDSEFLPYAIQLKVPVVHGDALNDQVMAQAGLWRARGVVVATSSDLLNIKMALEARRLRPDVHVVLRVFNEQLDHNLERTRFGPNTVFSTSALAAPTLAAAAVCRGIKYALPLNDMLLGLAELTVTPGGYLDSRVELIERNLNVQVIAYRPRFAQDKRGEPTWHRHLSPTTRVGGGDTVLLLGTLYALGTAWQHGAMCQQIMTLLGADIQHHLTPQYNRVIVCGLGTVGYQVVNALHNMDPRPEIVVIINSPTSEALVEEVRSLGVRMLRGDARTRKVLHMAGIDQAYSVVAVTSDKLVNVQICLIARHMRRDIDLVLRVFSDDLAEQLESIFGLHTTYSTSVLASTTLAAAAVVRGAGYAIDIGNWLLSTASITVSAGDAFAGQTVEHMREQHGIVVMSLQRGEQFFLLPQHPDQPGTLFREPLQVGDELVVLAEMHTIAGLHSRVTPIPFINPHTPRQLDYINHSSHAATWPSRAAFSHKRSSLPAVSTPVPASEPEPAYQAAPAVTLPPPGEASQHWLEQLQRTEPVSVVMVGDVSVPENRNGHAEDSTA